METDAAVIVLKPDTVKSITVSVSSRRTNTPGSVTQAHKRAETNVYR